MVKLKWKFCAAQLMFCFESWSMGRGGIQVTIIFFFIFLLVRLWLGCIPKISFHGYLEVPQKFLGLVVGGVWVA